MRQFHVYILAGHSRVLYVGVTNDLQRRVHEHVNKLVPGFTSKYNVNQLVYYECFPAATAAIEREKQIKGWRRSKKIALIESMNPDWHDMAGELSDV